MVDPVRQLAQKITQVPLHIKDAEDERRLICCAADETLEAHHQMKDALTERLWIAVQLLTILPVGF